MKKSIRIIGVFLAVLLAAVYLCVFAGAEETIGYKLVARKNGDYITAEIYVTNGVAMTGKTALTFDPAKVTPVNYDKTAITSFKLNDVVKSVIGTAEVPEIIGSGMNYSDSSVVITSETNYDESVLLGDNYLYFAWFANYSSFVDASANPVKIAEIKFAVAPGAQDLSGAVTLRPEAPSAESGIVGYKAGLYIGEYLDGKNISHYSKDGNYTISFVSTYSETEEFVVTGNTLTEYNGEGGNVEIPGNVTSIESGVFGESTTAVKIPTAVAEIKSGAFKNGTTIYVSPKFSVEIIADLKAEGNTIILYGDMDADGSVDVEDFKLYIKSLGGSNVEIKADSIAADVNDDSKLSLKDLSRFIKFLAGLSGADLGYQG